jgi:hypothetical protein
MRIILKYFLRMSLMLVGITVGVLLITWELAYAVPQQLPPPYDTVPFDTDGSGPSASNLFGSFQKLDSPLSGQLRYFIGSDTNEGGTSGGSLIMKFPVLFTDGPGPDFAIITNSQSWGPLADTALFKFFQGSTLMGSYTASLAPDRLFLFDLPGTGILADRIVLTNTTPDPPGTNNLATMTFDNAGVRYATDQVSHSVPEPSIHTLLAIGFAILAYWQLSRNRVRNPP